MECTGEGLRGGARASLSTRWKKRSVAAVSAGEKKRIARVTTERSLDIRYIGQSYDIRVPLRGRKLKSGDIYERFEELYRERYGIALSDPVEVTNVHVTATAVLRGCNFRKSQRAEKGEHQAEAQ